MALQLFRLAAETPVVTNTKYAYCRPMSADLTLTNGASYTLDVSTWYKGDGNAATAFVSASGYNLCVNGVLQQSGLYTVSSGDLKLVAPATGLTISQSSPITLEATTTDFAPTEVVVP